MFTFKMITLGPRSLLEFQVKYSSNE